MGFWGGLADGFTGAASGTWEGLKSLAKGGYALATDPAARERAWEATKSGAQAVYKYADKVADDPAKLVRDARDGALAAYTAAENFVTTADAEDWGKLMGGGVFEGVTNLTPVGALAKAGKLGKLTKVGRGLDKVEDVADVVEDAADAAKKFDRATPECVQKCPLKRIPPESWGKFNAKHNDEFMDALEEFRGTSDLTPTPNHSGREGQLFTSPKDPHTVLKRWFEKSPVEMEESIQALEDVRKNVGNNPKLINDIDVVRIHERGSDWIKRDYDPDSAPLRDMMKNPKVVEARARVMEELGRSRDESLGSLAKKLRRDPPSANLHWSPTKRKSLSSICNRSIPIMRTFQEIAEELGLMEFTPSRCGTLYFVPAAKGAPRVIVRHFDSELSPSAVTPYVELIRACRRWIEQYPELVRLVRIEEPFEIGRDFYARTHHSYAVSLNSYIDTDPEEGLDPPPELAELRLYLRNALSSRLNKREGIVEKVLRRSLLEPSPKTWFAEDIEQFIVVEPRIAPEDIQAWAKQS